MQDGGSSIIIHVLFVFFVGGWVGQKRVVSVNPVVNTANTQTQGKEKREADTERRSKWKEPRKVGGGDETRQKKNKK